MQQAVKRRLNHKVVIKALRGSDVPADQKLEEKLKRLCNNKSKECEVWTDNKVDLLLNITLEYEVHKTQENGRVDGLLSGQMQNSF